jgi:hypothetical protein
MPLSRSQTYLTSSGLVPFYLDLGLLAQRLVGQIDRDTSVYMPKRARGRVGTISRGWRESLKNYEWPMAPDLPMLPSKWRGSMPMAMR